MGIQKGDGVGDLNTILTFFDFFFFFFLATLWHMKVPVPGIKSEPQL